MHHRLGLIGKELKKVQQAVIPVVCNVADPEATLIPCTHHRLLNSRRVQKQVLVDVDDGIGLWFPRLQLACRHLCQGCWVVEKELGIEAGTPPSAKIVVAAASTQILLWAQAAIRHATGCHLSNHVSVHAGILAAGRVYVPIPVLGAGSLCPGEQYG